ncbi:MAG: alpha/beta hydrolase family protein [Moraxellaceae bacterium]|nr:alpha/beta hydrolase family protein [Moraxellaceae bacterium]
MEQIASRVSRVANDTYGHSRRLMPEQPWWNNLDPSFHKFPDDFYLDLPSQLMVDGTAAIDIGMRTALATLAASFALPATLWPANYREDRAQWDFYKAIAERHDPAAFFPRPQQHVNVRHHKAGLLDYHPRDGRVEVLSFESHFETVNPALRDKYARFRRNRTAWAEHWRHEGDPRPTICVIHGFVADPYWVNSRFLALPWFYKQGYDVLLYTLPFHGRRQEATSPFSGHGYFSHGLSHLNETVAHAVHDFRLFLDYLEGLGVPQMGVTGISLGGYTSALLATVEERLAFAVPNVPLASIMDLILQWFPAGPLMKAGLRLAGSDIREARHATAVQCPLTYPVKLPKERLLIVGGAGDRFAPPKHARLLWDHWDRPRLHWFPGNHLIHLDQGKYLKEMATFLKDIGFDRG